MLMLAGMWKRARRFAKKGDIDAKHALFAAWSNCKMVIEAKDEISEESIVEDLVFLDWFANKVEDFCKSNMIEGDDSFAAICYEWLTHMYCVPVPALQFEKKYQKDHGVFIFSI